MSNWIPIKLVEQSMAVRDAEIAELKAELRKKAIDSISDIGQLGELSAENVHLREENAHLKTELTDCKAEADRLKAEVERLKAIVGADAIDREHGMCCDSSSEIATLKAEVEWLNDAIVRGAIIPDAKPE